MFGFRPRACCTIFLSKTGSTAMKQSVEQFITMLNCLAVKLKRVFISIVLEVLVTHNLLMYFYKPFFQQSSNQLLGIRMVTDYYTCWILHVQHHEYSQSTTQLTVTHNSLTHQHTTNCTCKPIAHRSYMSFILVSLLVTPPNPRNRIVSNLSVP